MGTASNTSTAASPDLRLTEEPLALRPQAGIFVFVFFFCSLLICSLFGPSWPAVHTVASSRPTFSHPPSPWALS